MTSASTFARLFCRHSTRRAPQSAHAFRLTRRRLLLESLEDRSLMAGFNFADFSDGSSLNLAGVAEITADHRLRLTPSVGGQVGSAWYASERVFLTSGFSTTFQFQLAENFDSPG